MPLGVLERAREVGDWAERLRPITNPKMASDLDTAAALARAAHQGAVANVNINVESLPDDDFKREVAQRVAGTG